MENQQQTTAALLSSVEARVLGSLIEKEITTPDYYPLSLHALRNACNQSNNRDPVVAYDEPAVSRALDTLRDKKLAYVFQGAESRVPKFGHKFAETLGLERPEVAVLCVLMLRGPQTVGEIRGRTGRLHEFEGLDAVEATLQALSARQPQPLVARLPRQTGFKESRYAHLLFGEVSAAAHEAEPPAIAAIPDNERLARLETGIEALRNEMAELKQQFAEFRKQFE